MKKFIVAIGFLCISSYADMNELIEKHKDTFPDFLSYVQENGEKFGPIIATRLARQLFTIEDKDTKSIEFLKYYFNEKNEKQREQSLNKFLDDEKNKDYIKGLLPNLSEEKKLIRRVSLSDLSPLLKRKTQERVELKIDHEEYFDCMACNLFVIHLMNKYNSSPLDSDKNSNA